MRRYAKPIVVADDLNLLRGRPTGVVTLPRHLDRSGTAEYDLDSPGRISAVPDLHLFDAYSGAALIDMGSNRTDDRR